MKKLLTTTLLALTAALTAGAQSRTEVYTFPSEVLGAEKSCTVYLPDGYDRSQESYPVLYLLHGASGCHTDWTQKGDLRRIAAQATGFILPITGTCGFDQAQVTAGGLQTGEFDPRTMQSRLVPGLYACGEVLDVAGDCGGFNLQWAWSSGWLAGHLR